MFITRRAPPENTQAHSYALSWPAPFSGSSWLLGQTLCLQVTHVSWHQKHLSSFWPQQIIHSIFAFLICNPQQRFLALLLEGQGRITEEQVPVTEHSQSIIHQLPLPGICYVLNSKNLFQKQKAPSGIHAKMASWQPRAGGTAQGGSHVQTGQLPLQRCSATRAVRTSRGRRWEWDGMSWKRQIHAWRKTRWEGLCSCLALSTLLGSLFISTPAWSRTKCLQSW